MIILKLIITIFVLLTIFKLINQRINKKITLLSFILWVILWLIIALVFYLPETTSYLANIFGVGRGVDLAIYISIILVFYLLYKIFVRLNKIDREITKIVRKEALKDEE